MNLIFSLKNHVIQISFIPHITWFWRGKYFIPLFSFSQNEDDYGESCNKCTWSKYPNNEALSCDSYEDGECDFGIGFRGENYEEFDWVGEKCYEYLANNKGSTATSQTSGGHETTHQCSCVSKKPD